MRYWVERLGRTPKQRRFGVLETFPKLRRIAPIINVKNFSKKNHFRNSLKKNLKPPPFSSEIDPTSGQGSHRQSTVATNRRHRQPLSSVARFFEKRLFWLLYFSQPWSEVKNSKKLPKIPKKNLSVFLHFSGLFFRKKGHLSSEMTTSATHGGGTWIVRCVFQPFLFSLCFIYIKKDSKNK